MTIKRITIRVPDTLHGRLEACAGAENVSLNTLATRALEAYAQAHGDRPGHWPLAELSTLLAPAAAADNIDEAELLGFARQVRQQIWRERYADVVRAHAARRSQA